MSECNYTLNNIKFKEIVKLNQHPLQTEKKKKKFNYVLIKHHNEHIKNLWFDL